MVSENRHIFVAFRGKEINPRTKLIIADLKKARYRVSTAFTAQLRPQWVGRICDRLGLVGFFLQAAVDVVLVMRRAGRERFDIFYCAHPALLPAAILIRLRSHAPVVYNSQEFYGQNFAERLPGFLRWLGGLFGFFELKMASVAELILTIPSRDDRWRKRYERPGNQVLVLANYPPVRWDEAVPLAERANRLSNHVAVYIGGIGRAKGVFEAVRAMAMVRKEFTDARLLLVGDLLHDADGLEDLVRELDLGEAVSFFPWRPYEELAPLLNSSSLGLSLERMENRYQWRENQSAGNMRKGATYMRFGLPVVASTLDRLVQEVGCGVNADPPEAATVAEAICGLWREPQRGVRLGELGYKAVCEQYNWESQTSKMLRGFADLLSEADNAAGGIKAEEKA